MSSPLASRFLLQVDQAYFGILRAQAVLTVAQQTVKDRQLVSDQVTELEKNKIKSGLGRQFCECQSGAGAVVADSGPERLAGFVRAAFSRSRLLRSANLSIE